MFPNFDLEIKHIQGKENVSADYLSGVKVVLLYICITAYHLGITVHQNKSFVKKGKCVMGIAFCLHRGVRPTLTVIVAIDSEGFIVFEDYSGSFS